MNSISKITKKGQVTIPKRIRDLLNSDIIEFEVRNNGIYIQPVKSVAGGLKRYARKYVPLNKIRDNVWEKIVKDKI